MQNLGKYRNLCFIGEGGMARVYRALAPNNSFIAIKIPKEGADLDRFSVEAEVMLSMNHPNIVKVLEFGEGEGIKYMAMEYVDFPDLARIQSKSVCIPPGIVIQICSCICDALFYVYNQGWILAHRDVKPSNIFAEINGGRVSRVKLADFGVVKTTGSKKTVLGTAMGTPEYVSPEQLKSENPDQRSDIYSLGIVLYEMLVGRPPFTGPDLITVITKQLGETPIPPRRYNPETPPELESIILKCLEKNPYLRPQTIQELKFAVMKVTTKEIPLKTFTYSLQRSTPVPIVSQAGNIKIKKILGGFGLFFLFILTIGLAFLFGYDLRVVIISVISATIFLVSSIILFSTSGSSGKAQVSVQLEEGVKHFSRHVPLPGLGYSDVSFGQLVVISGRNVGKIYALNHPHMSFGRNPGLNISLPMDDLTISRYHGNIVFTDGRLVIYNRSGNGTVVNGVSIDKYELKNGDEIQVGSTIMRFQKTRV